VHFIVPADVFSLQMELWGAGGGSTGGAGGYVAAVLSVTPGEDLTINIAGAGRASFGPAAVLGGFGGGAAGTGAQLSGGTWTWGGSGGGATSILLGSTLLLDAAGGGGGGAGHGYSGGGGGGLIGSPGIGIPGGGGGTQTAGGVNNGASPSWPCNGCNGGFGVGGGGDLFEGGGGGGGGYYGGAGGASGTGAAVGGTLGGGGGGSSYIGGPGVSNANTLAGGTGSETGAAPANTSDPNYQSGIGQGAAYGTDGGNGLAVISFAAVPEPSTGTMMLAVLVFFFIARARRPALTLCVQAYRVPPIRISGSAACIRCTSREFGILLAFPAFHAVVSGFRSRVGGEAEQTARESQEWFHTQ
jgi:hypothetical protein